MRKEHFIEKGENFDVLYFRFKTSFQLPFLDCCCLGKEKKPNFYSTAIPFTAQIEKISNWLPFPTPPHSKDRRFARKASIWRQRPIISERPSASPSRRSPASPSPPQVQNDRLHQAQHRERGPSLACAQETSPRDVCSHLERHQVGKGKLQGKPLVFIHFPLLLI